MFDHAVDVGISNHRCNRSTQGGRSLLAGHCRQRLLVHSGFHTSRPCDKPEHPGRHHRASRVFDNLEAILAGAGCTWKDVVKVTVYMTNLADFSKMNDVMAARVGESKPARSTVGVASLPSGVALEVDVIAKLPK